MSPYSAGKRASARVPTRIAPRSDLTGRELAAEAHYHGGTSPGWDAFL